MIDGSKTFTKHRKVLPFSPIRASGGLFHFSGRVARDRRTGRLEAEGCRAQTRVILDNIRRDLEAAGYGVNNITRITIFLKNMADLESFDRVWNEAFPSCRPARTCVAVPALPNPAAVVEVELVGTTK